MRKVGLDPEDIPGEEPNVSPEILKTIKKSCRYFHCKAFAEFDVHIPCFHSWKSAHVWCILDLKKRRICRKWRQKCRQCNKKCIPSFDKSSVRRMAEFAVDLCLKRLGRREYEVRDPTYDLSDMEKSLTGPHDEERCEMCQELGHSCWY